MKAEDFEIRKISAEDIFPMCDIIGKCGISEFKNCFLKNRKGDYKNTGIAVMFELAGIICKNISLCEKELFSFVSDLCNVDEETVRSMEPSEFLILLKIIFEKKEMKDFFTAVSELVL